MGQSWERSHLVGLQSDLLDGDDQTISTRLPEHNTHYSPQGNAPFSHPYAEVDPLGTLPSQNSGVHADSGVEGDLDESLAGLELNGNDGVSNSELPDSTFGGANGIGMNANRPQRVPEMVSPWLLSESASNYTFGAYTIPTVSQPSNGADSPSAQLPLGHWSGESFANLGPPTYIPQRSSAATHSQNSDSAWETLPSSPFADDNDSRLVPDENSALMQSYPDPLTGIGTPEDAYGRGTAYSSMRDIGYDDGVNHMMTQSLRPDLRQVIANADAATPFRTQFDSNGGVVERFFYPLGSDQGCFANIVPRIVLDYPSPSATDLPSTMLMGPLAPAPSPSPSADTSTAGVVKCTHRGCRAKFMGVFWKDSLRRHNNHFHEDKKKPTCPVCQFVFKSGRPDNLKRHIMDKHPEYPLPASRTKRARKVASRRRRG